jgi:thymidylate synthase
MNNLDKQYTDLLQDILDNGVTKSDRTGTGTISVFGRQIRHKMSDGFPLLTTKKMAWKSVVTELLWFLRGDTNIKFLVDNDTNIWNGDAYKSYLKHNDEVDNYWIKKNPEIKSRWKPYSKEEFINRIKINDEFAKEWGELGPIYGKQWRSWKTSDTKSLGGTFWGPTTEITENSIDQIANLINDLKTNPDSRRLMVNAWNVGELDKMVLPPCHFSFQVYTRELSHKERSDLKNSPPYKYGKPANGRLIDERLLDSNNVPTRAISLMWNQRSVDTFLGLPFNIASYGLLLEIIAKAVNMVPDELIGNLGDVHLYSNHVEQAKEQIGRELSIMDRIDLADKKYDNFDIMDFGIPFKCTHEDIDKYYPVPKRTREPFPLPTLNINTEFWPYEGGECGVGPLDAVKVFESFKNETFCKCLLEEDIQLSNYQSHPTIKAPLSN